jgi:adenine/guanine phosphoribosyltransferase-like PRPP-binding protein
MDPGNVAKQLNAALDAMVTANDALANAGTGSVVAAVSDLVARGQSVNAMVTALGK